MVFLWFSYSFLSVFLGSKPQAPRKQKENKNKKKTKRKPKENQRKPEEKKTAAPPHMENPVSDAGFACFFLSYFLSDERMCVGFLISFEIEIGAVYA